MMRLEAEVQELGVFRVVVMLLGFHARVGNMIDLNGNPRFLCGSFDEMSEIQDRKLLCELVVDPAFVLGRRVMTGKLDAPYCVANVEEAARLPTLAVNGKRLSNGGLNAEAI